MQLENSTQVLEGFKKQAAESQERFVKVGTVMHAACM
jgi:hypothetical protein